jgi:predicted PurR-regulated permease PerM
MAKAAAPPSPRWTATTKLIAGLTIVTLAGAFLVRFSGFLGPLLMAGILSYLLYPLAKRVKSSTQLSWRASVGIVFLVFLIIFIFLLVQAGVAIVEQLGTLVGFLQGYVATLPETLQSLSEHAFQLGPFTIDLAAFERMLVEGFGLNFSNVGQQLLSAVQPALGQAGTFVGALATSAFATIGWILFIFLITFLFLSDAEERPDISNANLPGHDADFRRLGSELAKIWNAFLRGQMLLVGIIILSSFTLMTLLGVRNALALALITGLAKFIPYIGSFAMYVTTALVTFFQPDNYLAIEPGTTYMLFATIPAILMDLTFDNLVTPRFYGRALGVHPAAVLITALVAANLLGFVGLLLAAPVLASLQLFATYVFRKMLDLDPWPKVEEQKVKRPPSLAQRLQRFGNRVRAAFQKPSKRKAVRKRKLG